MLEPEPVDHEILLDVLNVNKDNGVSLFALSRATRIPMHQLRKYFRRHQYAFQPAAIGRNYRLNQKAPYYGDIKRIRNDLLQEIARERRMQYCAYIAIGFASLYSILLPLFLVL